MQRLRNVLELLPTSPLETEITVHLLLLLVLGRPVHGLADGRATARRRLGRLEVLHLGEVGIGVLLHRLERLPRLDLLGSLGRHVSDGRGMSPR